MKRLLIATDAWSPQVNGVVRSLEQMVAHAPDFGFEVAMATPSDFRSVAMPGYAEIRLSLVPPFAGRRILRRIEPGFVHIATEGPIGLSVRSACIAEGLPFTTSYHTKFPEYLSARLPVSPRASYAALRRFHGASAGTMVSTASLRGELSGRGFRNLRHWGRGVDLDTFRPRRGDLGLAGPVFLYVGRLAVEKNLDAFLSLDLPGTKLVVGDGPDRGRLERIWPSAVFAGSLSGTALADAYAGADAFVFPSLTDTFGLVLLEALACGTPVAAFPVPGPLDVIGDSGCGVLSNDLRTAALQALAIPRDRCAAYGAGFTWRASAAEFFANVEMARMAPALTAPVETREASLIRAAGMIA